MSPPSANQRYIDYAKYSFDETDEQADYAKRFFHATDVHIDYAKHLTNFAHTMKISFATVLVFANRLRNNLAEERFLR